MAKNRTMRFYGSAYGETPVTLTVTVDGTQVFNGTVNTINEPMTVDAYEKIDSVLFEVSGSPLFTTAFSGALDHTITVTGGAVVLGRIDCNYMDRQQTGPDKTGTWGNVTTFAQCFTGTPVNSDGTPDPRSSVTIDGVDQTSLLEPSAGVRTWMLTSDSTLACKLNVSPGSTASYV